MSGDSFADPVEIRRRIDRFAARIDRRDDYGQLLARGDVIRPRSDITDPDAWRAELRRHARADKIKIRTGATDDIVYAILAEGATPARMAESGRYTGVLSRVVPLAARHRHEPKVLARDGDEAVFTCERCPALGYADASDDTVGGALFEDDCADPNPPKPNALTFMYIGFRP